MKTNPQTPLIVLLLLIVSMATTAQTKQNWITVYTDDFSGYHYDLGAGRYDNIYLRESGLSYISSIKVPAGMKVTLFSEDNYRGYSLVLTEDARLRYLEGKGFAKVEMDVSMVVEQLPAGTPAVTPPFITIYQDSFSGASKNLRIGYYESFEFGDIDNDQISSVKIPKGLQVTLFENKGYGGRSLVLTTDASADVLLKNKFNDATSSLRVEAIDTVKAKVVVQKEKAAPKDSVIVLPKEEVVKGPYVTLFQGDFTGKSKKLVPGRYSSTDLNIGDNDLSSIKIPKVLRVMLYDEDGFKGRSLEISERDASSTYLIGQQFNDLTSSLIVEEIPRVVAYEHDMAGNSFSLDPGFYNTNDLTIGNDNISSLAIPDGMWVLLFENMAYEGRSLLLTKSTNTAVLQRNQFDNATSSIMVGNGTMPLPEVEIHSDDFNGSSKKLSPGYYEAENLGIGDNALSSIRIPRGLRVTLFETAGRQGRKMIISKSVGTNFLDFHQFNDITSAVQIDIIKPEELLVTIFDGSYNGPFQTLAPGRYDVSDIVIGEKVISSIRIPTGMRVTLYEKSNFKGSSVMLDRNRDFSGTSSLDNYYSSLVVEDAFEPFVTPVPEKMVVTPPKDTVKEAQPQKVQVEVKKVPECTMSEKEYYTALQAVESKSFSQEKMNTALLATKAKCLTNDQIRGIAKLFDFEDQTLEFVKYAYTLAPEKSTYYTLEDIFKYMSSKEAFTRFLSTK